MQKPTFTFAIAPPIARRCITGVDRYQVQAHIGVNADELGHQQRLIVSVELETHIPPYDSMEAAFDYSTIPLIIETVAAHHTNLIETFAANVARDCLRFPLVERAVVKVEKPSALGNGGAWTRVELWRTANTRDCPTGVCSHAVDS